MGYQEGDHYIKLVDGRIAYRRCEPDGTAVYDYDQRGQMLGILLRHPAGRQLVELYQQRERRAYYEMPT
jgi:hypothetical protein